MTWPNLTDVERSDLAFQLLTSSSVARYQAIVARFVDLAASRSVPSEEELLRVVQEQAAILASKSKRDVPELDLSLAVEVLARRQTAGAVAVLKEVAGAIAPALAWVSSLARLRLQQSAQGLAHDAGNAVHRLSQPAIPYEPQARNRAATQVFPKAAA